MMRARRSELLDAFRIGCVKRAQKFVQGAENLFGQLRGYFILRLTRPGKQFRKSSALWLGEKAGVTKYKIEATKHRATRDGPEASKWKGKPSRCLSARRVDKPQMGSVYEHSDCDAAFAEEAFELMMRRCIPTIEDASLVGIQGSVKFYENLERALIGAA